MKVELVRQLRRRRTLVGLVGIAAVPVLLGLAFRFSSDDDGNGGGDPTGLFSLATESAGNFALTSLVATAPFLLLAVVALFAGDAVSSEASWGSLRYSLVRPVPRSRLLARKLAVAAVLSVAAAILVPVSGYLTGGILFGWGAVETPFGILATGPTLARLALATAYVVWSAAWVAGLAFLLSIASDVPVGAVAGTIVTVIVVQILEAITALGDLRTWLPVHELNAWIGLLASPPRYGDLVRGLWLQLPYAAVFLGLAWRWFARKDILS